VSGHLVLLQLDEVCAQAEVSRCGPLDPPADDMFLLVFECSHQLDIADIQLLHLHTHIRTHAHDSQETLPMTAAQGVHPPTWYIRSGMDLLSLLREPLP
jgi:hypothetical protein